MAKTARTAQRKASPKPLKKPNEIVVMLGGGAPNFTLMSGALLELHPYLEQKRQAGKPLYFTMAGAGAVVGLMYLAPKNMNPAVAMKNTTNFGISDLIYEMCPINYKMFGKLGPSADAFNQIWFNLPEVQAAQNQYGMSDADALRADWLLFLGAMMCPTDLNFFSQGFSDHPHLIESLIDFDRLNVLDPNQVCIEINAFCIEKRELIDFTNYETKPDGTPIRIPDTPQGKLIKKNIVPEQLRAALAFPFIYPPYKFDGNHYYEGAAFQCLNQIAADEIEKIECYIVLDPMQANLIGCPRNLWESFALAIIMPTSGLAELGRQLLDMGASMPALPRAPSGGNGYRAAEALLHLGPRVYYADFKIDPKDIPDAWGWSRSSLRRLFEIGQIAGRQLCPKLP